MPQLSAPVWMGAAEVPTPVPPRFQGEYAQVLPLVTMISKSTLFGVYPLAQAVVSPRKWRATQSPVYHLEPV